MPLVGHRYLLAFRNKVGAAPGDNGSMQHLDKAMLTNAIAIPTAPPMRATRNSDQRFIENALRVRRRISSALLLGYTSSCSSSLLRWLASDPTFRSIGIHT